MSPTTLVLTLGALAAAANLVGGAITILRRKTSEKVLLYGLAFSGGFLLSVALLHIIPECVESTPSAPLLFIAGYFLVYIAEHLFAGHAHHAVSHAHGAHPLIGSHGCRRGKVRIRVSAAWSAVAGLTLHSFFDGAAIAAAASLQSEIGWLTFFAVALHKIPEGFSLSAIVLSSTCSRRASLVTTGILAASSMAGTVATVFAARLFTDLGGMILSIAAGMFVHIAATDLLPTTSYVRGMRVMSVTVAGALSVVAVSLLLSFAL